MATRIPPPPAGFTLDTGAAPVTPSAVPPPPPGFKMDTPSPTAVQLQAQETGPFQAGAIATGKGAVDILRFLGVMDPESPFEKESFAALKEENPISTGVGEVVGQALPFVAAEPLIAGAGAAGLARLGVSASKPILGRIALGTALGAVEGGAVAESEGGDAALGAGIGGAIGGISEAVLPSVLRLGGRLIRKTLGRAPKGALVDAAGVPSVELREALDTAGITFDDLTQAAQQQVGAQAPGAAPEQVARGARAAEEGIPLTTGQQRQDFDVIRGEEELRGATTAGGEQLRQFDLVQSDAINAALENLSGTKGVTKPEVIESTGTAIREALTGKVKLLETQKKALYKEAGELAKDKGGIPIFTDNLAEALPSPAELRRMGRIKGAETDAIQELLVEFGVITDGKLAEDFVEAGGEIIPLSLENAEEFRVALGQIISADKTGVAGVIGGPIKKALDGELDTMFEVLKDVEGMPTKLLDTLKEARGTVRQLKTEFTPKDLTGQIIALKPDNFTNVTEASKVYDKITGKAATVESVRRTVNTLRASGEDGVKGLNALRTTVILDLLDAAFKTKSKTVSGVPVFNPVAFKNRLANIGDEKIAAIFQGDANALGKLRNIDKIAQDLIPPGRATPKGSSDFVAPLLKRMLTLNSANPLAALIVNAGSKTAEAVIPDIVSRRAAGKAIKGAPEVLRIRGELEKNFPSLAAALGIAAVSDRENQ